MEISKEKEAHVVLVHGACHGAWCWYKLKPLLEACGLRVTALDLSASGIDSRSLQELRSFKDYTQPLLELMESLPPEEKVVLVGHSLGGINIGLAMDMFPHKISVAIFLAAFMPDSVHGQSYVLDQLSVQIPPENLDTVFSAFGTPEEPLTAMLFGPLFLSKLYHLCSPEEVALAKMLSRPCSLFLEDLSKKAPFSNERFGSLKRIYIVCTEDKSFPLIFQEWLIETIGVDEVKQIEADHMPMISRPKELCQCLVDIATKYN